MSFPIRPAALAVLAVALLATFPAVPARAADEPARVVVLPLADRRAPEAPGWQGAWLRDAICDALRRGRRAALVPPPTAELWARRFGLAPGAAPGEAQLVQTGARVAVAGSFQTVLGITRVYLDVTGPDAPPAAERVADLDARRDGPQQAATRVLALLVPLLPAAHAAAPPAQPASWATLERFHTLRSAPLALDDAAAVEGRIAALNAFLGDPALAPAAAADLARLHLVRGLRHLPPGGERERALRTGLALAARAVEAEPWHDGHRLLKAELHYFLKDDYLARSEASVARLKNPLNGRAYLVLGLAAGLSTGEANEHLKQALALDPFLEAKNLPPGTLPVQGGLLEPLLEQWRTLKSGRRWESPGYQAAFAEGMAHFEAQRWDEAIAAFEKALEADETRYEPLLQIYRVLLETGRPDEAVPLLRTLAQEYPQQAEIHFALGRALEDAHLPGEARQAYLRALVEDPGMAEARFRAAAMAAEEGRWELALEALGELLRRQPAHEAGWLLRSEALANLGRWEAADEALAEVLRLNPGSEAARGLRARIAPRLARPAAEPPPAR